MIQFKISAPSSLSLFGDRTQNQGRKSLMGTLDLRTTLTFEELSPSDGILKINFPQISLAHRVLLDEFQTFYYDHAKDTASLHRHVERFTENSYESASQRLVVQAFYYLLVTIFRWDGEVTPFRVNVTTEFILDDELGCPASFTVSLAACLVHWLNLQRDERKIFTLIDRQFIQMYAEFCSDISPESETVNVTACTYGSVVKYNKLALIMRPVLPLDLPVMTVMLVDTKRAQDQRAQTEQLFDMKFMLPGVVCSILDCIDSVTEAADRALQSLDGWCTRDLNAEAKRDYIEKQQDILRHCIRINRELLNALKMSNELLDEICNIARTFGMYGKSSDWKEWEMHIYLVSTAHG